MLTLQSCSKNRIIRSRIRQNSSALRPLCNISMLWRSHSHQLSQATILPFTSHDIPPTLPFHHFPATLNFCCISYPGSIWPFNFNPSIVCNIPWSSRTILRCACCSEVWALSRTSVACACQAIFRMPSTPVLLTNANLAHQCGSSSFSSPTALRLRLLHNAATDQMHIL